MKDKDDMRSVIYCKFLKYCVNKMTWVCFKKFMCNSCKLKYILTIFNFKFKAMTLLF